MPKVHQDMEVEGGGYPAVSCSFQTYQYQATEIFLCCQGSPSRLTEQVGFYGVVLIAHCNVFLNALIYISQYNVVRMPMIRFVRAIAAKFTNHQPSTSITN